MAFARMKPLERLTKEYWEARPDTVSWEDLKKWEPHQALQAFEQMRAAIKFLAPNICSVSDKLWLTRITQDEEFPG